MLHCTFATVSCANTTRSAICRIAIIQVVNGDLGEQVASVNTEEAPLRIALHPQVNCRTISFWKLIQLQGRKEIRTAPLISIDV